MAARPALMAAHWGRSVRHCSPMGHPAALIELVTCFAAGTRIAMPRGDVSVERLAVGDAVLTVGECASARPITWIGQRHVDIARHRASEQVLPIRIARDAFGDGQPGGPLLLSPDRLQCAPTARSVTDGRIGPGRCGTRRSFRIRPRPIGLLPTSLPAVISYGAASLGNTITSPSTASPISESSGGIRCPATRANTGVLSGTPGSVKSIRASCP